MVRIAMAGDIHCGAHETLRVREQFADVGEHADLLLLAGDLTNHGSPEEMRNLALQLASVSVPVVAVFGNHDVHCEQEDEARQILEAAGVQVLEKQCTTLDVRGARVGIAGAKGFGGGFRGGCASTFGEREMRMFLAPTHDYAAFFEQALRTMDADIRLALMHYAPIPETLVGERWEIFPFLGAYQLGDAVDAGGADLALHGHAHRGTERGTTTSGVPVRNVAQAVLKQPYSVYEIAPRGLQLRVAAVTGFPAPQASSSFTSEIRLPVGM